MADTTRIIVGSICELRITTLFPLTTPAASSQAEPIPGVRPMGQVLVRDGPGARLLNLDVPDDSIPGPSADVE